MLHVLCIIYMFFSPRWIHFNVSNIFNKAILSIKLIERHMILHCLLDKEYQNSKQNYLMFRYVYNYVYLAWNNKI